MGSATKHFRRAMPLFAAAVLAVCAASASAAPFNIVINAGPMLAGNSAALAAFNRAAAEWAGAFSDPITVNISADLGTFGNPSIIGSTSSVQLQASYTIIRNAMVADAADEPNDSIVASLPTAAQFSAIVPSGSTFSGNIVLTKANAKSLGFTGLDTSFGSNDGTITFNSAFSFDYDSSNGVSPGTIDFQTTAAHEIGHLLGFQSVVDSIDAGSISLISPNPLDLFRFQDNVANRDPSTASEFTTFPRYLSPGGSAIFDDITNEYALSTGLTQGDGRQASHWKDDALTANFIGIMDPTLASGVVETAGTADFRALDLIGYEFAPEPASIALFAAATGGLLLRRRNRAA